MLLDRKDEWLAARLEDLDYGYIDGIVAAARKFPLTGVKKNELDTALGYFENNAARMRGTMPTSSDQSLARISLSLERRWPDRTYHRCRAALRGTQAT